ncbi:MAG: hypothetical protein FWG25_09955, partial [Promicromonosporaceae bacterium]|nr:hypothetical protein [Promicromonosporaceae bacterium]
WIAPKHQTGGAVVCYFMRLHGTFVDMEFPEKLSDQVVLEIKLEMVRVGISSVNALGRAIGKNSQYVNQRLSGGNPETGRRVPLNMLDLGLIADALQVDASELVRRAEANLDP